MASEEEVLKLGRKLEKASKDSSVCIRVFLMALYCDELDAGLEISNTIRYSFPLLIP